MDGLCALTPLQRKILRFFHEQPHAVESLRGICTWMGAQPEFVEDAVGNLLGRKWLTLDETSVVKGYSLTCDERFLPQIRQALRQDSG